jgi:hypothetical protein
VCDGCRLGVAHQPYNLLLDTWLVVATGTGKLARLELKTHDYGEHTPITIDVVAKDIRVRQSHTHTPHDTTGTTIMMTVLDHAPSPRTPSLGVTPTLPRHVCHVIQEKELCSKRVSVPVPVGLSGGGWVVLLDQAELILERRKDLYKIELKVSQTQAGWVKRPFPPQKGLSTLSWARVVEGGQRPLTLMAPVCICISSR